MTMKIIYKTMLLCVVVLSFFSCGNDDEPGIDTPPSNPELMVAEDALFVRIGEDTGAELEYCKDGGCGRKDHDKRYQYWQNLYRGIR